MINQSFCCLLRDISQFGHIFGYTSPYFPDQNFRDTYKNVLIGRFSAIPYDFGLI